MLLVACIVSSYRVCKELIVSSVIFLGVGIFEYVSSLPYRQWCAGKATICNFTTVWYTGSM